MSNYQTGTPLSEILGAIPECATVRCGDASISIPLPLSTRFETLVASTLQGEMATKNNPGFDVHNCALAPNQTFQVKVSNPGKVYPYRHAQKSRSYGKPAVWSFGQNAGTTADWYILFGINDELVNVFLLSGVEWQETSSLVKSATLKEGQRLLTIPIKQWCQQGGPGASYRQSKRWRFAIEDWPGDLLGIVVSVQKEDAA